MRVCVCVCVHACVLAHTRISGDTSQLLLEASSASAFRGQGPSRTKNILVLALSEPWTFCQTWQKLCTPQTFRAPLRWRLDGYPVVCLTTNVWVKCSILSLRDVVYIQKLVGACPSRSWSVYDLLPTSRSVLGYAVRTSSVSWQDKGLSLFHLSSFYSSEVNII